MNLKTLSVALVALALGLAGCVGSNDDAQSLDGNSGGGGASPARAPNTLAVRALDYGFEAPARVPAGLTEITLTNEGSELHHIQFFRLAEGKTVADVESLFANGHVPTPEWLTPVPGPNVALPGAPKTALVDLAPGEYVMTCIIPSPHDGIAHVSKGMIRGITVTPAEAGEAEVPAPDVTLSLTAFAFAFDGEVAAGKRVVRIVNDGPHDHEAVLFEMLGNATVDDLLASFGPDAEGPPPAIPKGGVSVLAPGDWAQIEIDFTPGRYLLICFDLDGTPHGEPHFAMGMVREFTVA